MACPLKDDKILYEKDVQLCQLEFLSVWTVTAILPAKDFQ